MQQKKKQMEEQQAIQKRMMENGYRNDLKRQIE